MKDRELLTKLNNLNQVKPSDDWKERNRSVLISQVSATRATDRKYNIFKLSFQMITSVSQPVMVVLLLFIVTGAVGVNLRIGEGSAPGDSLYIAKKISEKTRASFTFNEKKKAKLGVEFAKNRALEIEKVMADSDSGDKDEVEKLVNDLKSEIIVAKNRIEKFYSPSVLDNNTNSDIIESVNDSGSQLEVNEVEESITIHTANSEKDNAGIEVSGGSNNTGGVTAEDTGEDLNIQPLKESPPNLILAEVEDLIEKEDYATAIKRLDDAAALVDAINNEDVDKFVASSTENDLNKEGILVDDVSTSTIK